MLCFINLFLPCFCFECSVCWFDGTIHHSHLVCESCILDINVSVSDRHSIHGVIALTILFIFC